MNSINIEQIKQKFTLRKQPKYQKDYLYIGYTIKTENINTIQFTYQHYDIFLGNKNHLSNVTLLKRLTGNNANSINQYPRTEHPTIIDTHTNHIYTMQCNIKNWCYQQSFFGTCPKEFSMFKLQYMMTRTNQKNKHKNYQQQVKHIKQTNKTQHKLNIQLQKDRTMLEREFGNRK